MKVTNCSSNNSSTYHGLSSRSSSSSSAYNNDLLLTIHLLVVPRGDPAVPSISCGSITSNYQKEPPPLQVLQWALITTYARGIRGTVTTSNSALRRPVLRATAAPAASMATYATSAPPLPVLPALCGRATLLLVAVFSMAMMEMRALIPTVVSFGEMTTASKTVINMGSVLHMLVAATVVPGCLPFRPNRMSSRAHLPLRINSCSRGSFLGPRATECVLAEWRDGSRDKKKDDGGKGDGSGAAVG